MSADPHSTITLHAPAHICLTQTLPEATKTTITSLLSLLPADCIGAVKIIDSVQLDDNDVLATSAIHIKSIVDGRGLACPMPLLKTKVALREVNIGESLYVVATDPNSQADITAFCQQTQQPNTAQSLSLVLNQTTAGLKNNRLPAHTSDTIFHFIITKTDSN
ncbi:MULTISPECIES: sulfurtransferase TusA family protein [Psychrobacter]|uniref:sulfurtransferase TusA family protein n=1 Tax=Psychrobacter TaxID=497 RepID=UPI001919E0C8|nr:MULTISPECIES: sulfurtransferase TusA family protein [Psychrobacter]